MTLGAIYTKAELVVADDGRPQQLPWEDWSDIDDVVPHTSAWMRATAPSGSAAYEGRVQWAGELGFGVAQLSDLLGGLRGTVASNGFYALEGAAAGQDLATQAVPSLVMRFWLWLLHRFRGAGFGSKAVENRGG